MNDFYYEKYRNRINEMSNDELKEKLFYDYLRCCECPAYHELDRNGFFDNIIIDKILIDK